MSSQSSRTGQVGGESRSVRNPNSKAKRKHRTAMDSKYYSLVEIIAFAVLALGFCLYQIWTVRRKPGDETAKPSEQSSPPNEDVQK